MLQAQMESFNRQQRFTYFMSTTKLGLQIGEWAIVLRLQEQPEEGTIRSLRLPRWLWYAEIEFALPIPYARRRTLLFLVYRQEQNRINSWSQAWI